MLNQPWEIKNRVPNLQYRCIRKDFLDLLRITPDFADSLLLVFCALVRFYFDERTKLSDHAIFRIFDGLSYAKNYSRKYESDE